jgi:hypothetical protein
MTINIHTRINIRSGLYTLYRSMEYELDTGMDNNYVLYFNTPVDFFEDHPGDHRGFIYFLNPGSRADLNNYLLYVPLRTPGR